MARSILVPLDGSPLAEQALPLAEAIAKASRARIRLAIVHQLPLPPANRDSANLFLTIELATKKSESAYLRRIAKEIRGRPRSEVRTAFLEGPVGPALDRYVQEMGVDMIVMSTHGRGALDRLWLGSVADYLVRTANVPILLVRPGGKTKRRPLAATPRQILVPLDGSPLAEAALEPAVDLAKSLGVELFLVQVVTPVAPATDPLFPTGFDQQFSDLWREQAKDYLHDISERLRDEGVRATSATATGYSVHQALLDLAPEGSGVLIALATHGRGGLRRLMIGSVADKVIRGAHGPVLVVRPAKLPARPTPRPRKRARRRA
ncbi:MAG: universal stress protein [Gemmatimonadales bacterium]